MQFYFDFKYIYFRNVNNKKFLLAFSQNKCLFFFQQNCSVIISLNSYRIQQVIFKISICLYSRILSYKIHGYLLFALFVNDGWPTTDVFSGKQMP